MRPCPINFPLTLFFWVMNRRLIKSVNGKLIKEVDVLETEVVLGGVGTALALFAWPEEE